MMRHFANFRDALGAAALGGLLVAAGACSDTTSEDNAGASLDADGVSAGEAGSTGGDGSQDGFTGAGGGSSVGGDDDASETSDGSGSTGGEPGGEQPAPEAGPFEVCPDTFPEGWIFCEDFEAFGDPSKVFFDYVDADGNLSLIHI